MKKTYYSPGIAFAANLANSVPFLGWAANYNAAHTLSLKDYSIWNSTAISSSISVSLSSAAISAYNMYQYSNLMSLKNSGYSIIGNPDGLYYFSIFTGVLAVGSMVNYLTNDYADLNYHSNTKILGDITIINEI